MLNRATRPMLRLVVALLAVTVTADVAAAQADRTLPTSTGGEGIVAHRDGTICSAEVGTAP
jgi:hypothetical protein